MTAGGVLSVKDDDGDNNNNNSYEEMKRMKLVLGSRPPRCVNRCMSCRPCMAALVVPPRRKTFPNNNNSNAVKTPQVEESYYLLLWKCRCKNKIFQP
ncbi:hypothetical protein Nepgr_006363 [Nepenthes gracilis]|uniref:Epidermal patterning factor-like protein n=1 Tax=Nepenthes gracilis TaxID=150966 RepID=A0AAD3S4Z6_NEPGR|nr:hypothetical protein Nepgr_006363 [Nepenthes gracilis]